MRPLPSSLGSWLATLAVAVALTAPALAHAGSGRIVVMPFEGPDRLADDTRATIVSEVSRAYDVVPPTSWVKARRAAESQEFGPKVWSRAAKKAKVDALVEGKIVVRGKRATLAITVIDAHAGTEVDRAEIPMTAHGLDDDGEDRVRQELGELLGWVEGVSSTRSIGDADLTDMDDLKSLEDDDGDRGQRRRRDRRSDRRDRDDRDDRASVRDRDGADDRDRDGDDRDDDRDDDRRPGRGDDVMALFGDEAALSPAESTRSSERARQAATGVRRFTADASAIAFSRSRSFQGGPDAPLDYPGGVTKGLALAASIYPTSVDPAGRLGGVGVSLEYARGVASTAAVDIGEDLPVDYDVVYQEWAAAAHYRVNTKDLSVDGALGYRSVTHVLDVIDEVDDLTGAELDALDGEFGALTAGARLEFAATPRATVGIGAEYLYLTSIGVISETTMLGGGQAWGARAQADVQITLSKAAFLHVGATLSHYTVAFDGTGDMDADWEVDSITDTFLGGQLGLGLTY